MGYVCVRLVMLGMVLLGSVLLLVVAIMKRGKLMDSVYVDRDMLETRRVCVYFLQFVGRINN
jgi:hypothetical protein